MLHVAKVVQELSVKERSALMKFATSISRAPLGGFKHLNPPLTVHKVFQPFRCDAAFNSTEKSRFFLIPALLLVL